VISTVHHPLGSPSIIIRKLGLYTRFVLLI
jgi:hypothetical protein